MCKKEELRVLFAGETWITYETHIKGFDCFTVCKYGEGTKWLKAALEKNSIIVCHIPNHLAPVQFPVTLEQLREYDVVILSDIGSNTLLLHPDTVNFSKPTPNRLELLKKFVSQGGGLLMFGGYMSFQGIEGKAHYKDTPIEEILPVCLLPGDDRVEVPQGVHPECTYDHPITQGIPKKWPMILSYNKLIAKDGALILARHGNDPIFVVWDYGKGRTAAFAADCAPHGASPEFLEWKYYSQLWSQTVKWLARKL